MIGAKATVRWDQARADLAVRGAAQRAVVATVHAVLEQGTVLINSPPKSGIIYRRRGVVHQASAPGEPPATDLGTLVQSGYASYPEQSDLFVVTGYANWGAAHAIFLELGTQNMEPRPFARPALDFCAPQFPTRMNFELRAAAL